MLQFLTEGSYDIDAVVLQRNVVGAAPIARRAIQPWHAGEIGAPIAIHTTAQPATTLGDRVSAGLRGAGRQSKIIAFHAHRPRPNRQGAPGRLGMDGVVAAVQAELEGFGYGFGGIANTVQVLQDDQIGVADVADDNLAQHSGSP